MDAVTYSRGLLQRRRIIRTMDQSRNDYVCSPHLPLSLSFSLGVILDTYFEVEKEEEEIEMK